MKTSIQLLDEMISHIKKVRENKIKDWNMDNNENFVINDYDLIEYLEKLKNREMK